MMSVALNQFVAGNHIQLLRNGTEYFPAIVSSIQQAKHEVHLQSYIFEADAIGWLVANALIEAAQRGVRVKLLLDGFGSRHMPKAMLTRLESAGVEVMFYRPKISPWTLKKNRLRRLHRKVVLVDNQTGFLGGINIIDDYNVPDRAPPRIDYAVKINGPLVQALCLITKRLWRKLSRLHFREFQETVDCVACPALPHGVQASLVIRDNVLRRRDIEKAYLAAIHGASSHIVIANAYFLPNKTFRDALIEASQRGVKITLLLQGRVEYFYMVATRALYELLLKHHIEVYEYRKSFMHSKVAVIDQHWATVGSSNIDPFSLLLALEANVVVQDADFAQSILSDLQITIADGGHRITAIELQKSNVLQRALSWVAYTLVKMFANAFDRGQRSSTS